MPAVRIMLAFAGGGLLSAATFTYDVTVDWQNNSNPNGVWSYQQGSTLLPYQPNWDSGTCSNNTPGIGGGYAPGIDTGHPGCIPLFFKGTGNATNTNDWLAGDVVIHALDPNNGGGSGEATLRWTAPVSGTFAYTGDIWYAHSPVQRSDDFTLSLGANVLSSGTVAWNSGTGSNRSNMLSFSNSGPIAVTAGDHVDLVIQHSNGSIAALAGVQLSITETSDAPEPVTVALFGFGLATVSLLRRLRAR